MLINTFSGGELALLEVRLIGLFLNIISISLNVLGNNSVIRGGIRVSIK